MELLKGHISPETAYVVNDYPYGFRLRCKIRYWIEVSGTFGARFVSQTTNPKKAGEVWNKPKAGVYSRFGMAMYLNEQGHVEYTGLHEYMDNEKTQDWVQRYGEAVPDTIAPLMHKWVAAKQAYENKKAITES